MNKIKHQIPIDKVILFGSYAKGGYTMNSDIDIAIFSDYFNDMAGVNNIGNWRTNKVETTGNAKGFDFYTIKDKQMARDADYGLMIWNGKSKGTFNNIINLVKLNKTVLLYLIPNKQFYKVENISDIERLVKSINNNDINKFFLDKSTDVEQMRLEM